MNIGELKSAARQYYHPALLIDAALPFILRQRLLKVLRVVFAVVLTFLALYLALRSFGGTAASAFLDRLPPLPFFLALSAVAAVAFVVARAVEACYYSYCFKDLKPALPEPGLSATPPLTFAAASVVFNLDAGDLTKSFLETLYGRSILLRLGVPLGVVAGYLKSSRTLLSRERFHVVFDQDNQPVILVSLARTIFNTDQSLVSFLSRFQIDAGQLDGAAEWVERQWHEARVEKRWWGRDRLGRVPGIGKNWAYGGAYQLMVFAHEITEDPVFVRARDADPSMAGALAELEAILSRAREANVLLVGEEGVPKLEVVARLAQLIRRGTVLPPLEHKRIFVFDANRFSTWTKNKATFETELLRIMNDVVRTGNIILVFPDFAAFLEGSHAVGVDLPALLDPYLAAAGTQVIAVADTGRYHSLIAPNGKLMQRFEKVSVPGATIEAIVHTLEEEVVGIEAAERIFFTYPALLAIAQSADRYFPEGTLSDKALDLLALLIPQVKRTGSRVVLPQDVHNLVSAKTGIPTGEITTVEKEKLLNLEAILHERIIDQEEAIKGIAGAMRRARVGVGNPNRPIGSFLFLGPTGVGKTETAKALAATFFGREETLLRFDMSEYRTDDALERLIGSFKAGKPGILASQLREKSYGVLLLDEFEKTRKEVLDLFLQVLDEGFFSDAGGKRVNIRNLIIIATSNAGSDLIWELTKEIVPPETARAGAGVGVSSGGLPQRTAGVSSDGQSLEANKREIIDTLIRRGIFKPELLNRFDGIILFDPLGPSELRLVAGLMLAKLKKRLLRQGIELVVTSQLLDHLVEVGSDRQFGARPMQRAIQEKVEERLAEKMIRGEIGPGSRVELTAIDLLR